MDLYALTTQARPLLDGLHDLYAQMDRDYQQVAAAYGFSCRGCADNCCRTRFHHHTLIEWLDLEDGLQRMPPRTQTAILALATEPAPDAPCPLWDGGRCRLYGHRPMICRLHGLPHRLRRPDGVEQIGPGCAEFHRLCGPAYLRLDRTPLYRALAALEAELRQAVTFRDRIRMTVAEMIAAGRSGRIAGGEGA